MKSFLILALAIPVAAADSGGMVRDYTAALKKRAALDRELELRIERFTKKITGIEKDLDRDSREASNLCAQAVKHGEQLEHAATGIETIRAELALRLQKTNSKPCDGYALRRIEELLSVSTGPASNIDPLLSEAKSFARTRIRIRANAQSLAAPWDQRPGRLALISDEAQSLRTLFEEARQRLNAARVTRAEIQRLAKDKTSAPQPKEAIDYASRERKAVDVPFERLLKKISAMTCAASTAPTALYLDAAADAAHTAFNSLNAHARRCRSDAAVALTAELSDTPRAVEGVRLEELAYEDERKKHLVRDLDEWKRRRKREARRLAQQRRFAKTMRPPRRRKSAKGTDRKGPWLAWGGQQEPDAPIRLRVTDVDAFEADTAPYKRVLRPRAFRSLTAAQKWVCERLAGVKERPVVGRSAEFGEEIVALGDGIRCE